MILLKYEMKDMRHRDLPTSSALLGGPAPVHGELSPFPA